MRSVVLSWKLWQVKMCKIPKIRYVYLGILKPSQLFKFWQRNGEILAFCAFGLLSAPSTIFPLLLPTFLKLELPRLSIFASHTPLTSCPPLCPKFRPEAFSIRHFVSIVIFFLAQSEVIPHESNHTRASSVNPSLRAVRR